MAALGYLHSGGDHVRGQCRLPHQCHCWGGGSRPSVHAQNQRPAALPRTMHRSPPLCTAGFNTSTQAGSGRALTLTAGQRVQQCTQMHDRPSKGLFTNHVCPAPAHRVYRCILHTGGWSNAGFDEATGVHTCSGWAAAARARGSSPMRRLTIQSRSAGYELAISFAMDR